MTTYYVGTGGNDGNAGTSWATRKLTLNGAEDVPVVAGDIVYVAPGVYRESLTVDVSGGVGTPITYIGDVTGEHTDSVGGVVRVTGSNNDQSATRANCIVASAKDNRTFRGFSFDVTTSRNVDVTSGSNWIIEDCVLWGPDRGDYTIRFVGTGTSNTVRRCVFPMGRYAAVYFTNGATADNTGHLVENCRVFNTLTRGIMIERIGGITVRNCSFTSASSAGIGVGIALAAGQTTTVNNCIFCVCATALSATALGEITENYNTFYANGTDRSNVGVGANSATYPPIFLSPILYSGIKFPWWFGELSEWSPIRAMTGANEPAVDLHGTPRPATASKNSWGPVQFQDMERETGTVRASSIASLALHDAGEHQIFAPVSNQSTTVRVYVYREANYAGTNPRLVIRQPGQADITVTDTGAATSWNQLSSTFTPAAKPDYVVVALQSLNTAAAGNYGVFFDDLIVE